MNIVFSHRSFQEYFTAYCIVRLSEERAAELIRRFAWKSADTVLSMIFDMNKDFVTRAYLFPALSKYAGRTKDLTENSSLFDHIAALDCGFMIRYTDYTGRSNTILFYLYPFEHEMVAVRLVAFSLYKDTLIKGVERNRHSSRTYHPRKDYPAFRSLVLPTIKRIKGGKFFSLLVLQNNGTIEFHDQPIDAIHNLPNTAIEACQEWLRGAELNQSFWTEHIALLALYRSMCVDQARRGKSLDDILNTRIDP